MKLDDVAAALKELGHPTRLTIYRQLVKAGERGLPVGTVQKSLDIPGSTLNHHLSALAAVGLVKQIREGRILYCVAQYEVLDNIMTFLTEECCVGHLDEADQTS